MSLQRIPAVLLAFLTASSAFGIELKIPQVTPSNPNQFRSTTVRPMPLARSCQDVFVQDPRAWRAVQKIISAATKSFERRGWSKEFLAERERLAFLFRDRSEYVALTRPENTELVAELGVSWAQYSKTKSPDANRRVTELDIPHLLPGELSLHSKPFPRPRDSAGKGIIFELRAWAIDKASLSISERAEAFAHLFAKTTPLLFERLKAYPELYDQPVVYTYGDEASLKLYGMMGFKPVSKEPIQHEGSNWWTLAISPRDLEAFTVRLRSPQMIYNLNREFEVSLPQGKFRIQADSEGMRGGALSRNENGTTINFLAADAKVAQGIEAMEGAHVSWNPDGTLLGVSAITKPLEIEKGIVADMGSSVSFLKITQATEIVFNGRGELLSSDVAATKDRTPYAQDLKAVQFVIGDVRMSRGMWAEAGTAIAWTADRSTLLIEKLRWPAVIPGTDQTVWAPAGARIHITPWMVHISSLDRTTRLPNGKIVSKGNGLVLKKNSDGSINWGASEITPGD